jgi:hypothetical protein
VVATLVESQRSLGARHWAVSYFALHASLFVLLALLSLLYMLCSQCGDGELTFILHHHLSDTAVCMATSFAGGFVRKRLRRRFVDNIKRANNSLTFILHHHFFTLQSAWLHLLLAASFEKDYDGRTGRRRDGDDGDRGDDVERRREAVAAAFQFLFWCQVGSIIFFNFFISVTSGARWFNTFF